MARELRHAGVKGMKWGQRKAEMRPSQSEVYDARAKLVRNQTELNRRSLAAPSAANTARKKELTAKIEAASKTARQHASGKEKAATVAAGATILAGALSFAGAVASTALPSGPAQTGAAVISNLLAVAAVGGAVTTIATTNSANNDQERYLESR